MLRNWLRTVRAAIAHVIGGVLAAYPGIEPAFIASGRRLGARSRIVGTLYWFAQEDLLRRLRGSSRRFRVMPVAGVNLAVDVTDATGRMHYFHDEPYEPELSRAIAARLQSGDVFLDVGANTGYFSLLAGRLVGPEGRVAAFEPDPAAAAAMAEAVARNALADAIEIVPAAVSDSAGTTRLFLTVDSVLSTTDPSRSPARAQFAFPRSIDVPQVTLDGWLAARPDLVPRIRAIKIDVEGTEGDVLRGMRATLERCPLATILCETSAGSDADVFLRERGYEGAPLDIRRGTFGNYCYERRARPPTEGETAAADVSRTLRG
jgi:FkbM family methyltransferase